LSDAGQTVTRLLRGKNKVKGIANCPKPKMVPAKRGKKKKEDASPGQAAGGQTKRDKTKAGNQSEAGSRDRPVHTSFSGRPRVRKKKENQRPVVGGNRGAGQRGFTRSPREVRHIAGKGGIKLPEKWRSSRQSTKPNKKL